MARLNTHVHVVELDEKGNTVRSGVFGPDDEVPDWAVAAITNPDVWADDPPAPVAATAPSEPPTSTDPDRPRGNASREEWAEYARGRGVEVTGTMGRDEIKAAVDRAV